MDQTSSNGLERFRDNVGLKFQLYNSLFLSLPFYGVDKTGILLSLFNSDCEDGFARGESPQYIVEKFFEEKGKDETIDLLFRFVQYAERQVVLFDALEDAAFAELNDMQGAGTLKHLETAVQQSGRQDEFLSTLKDFSVRLVLTAHPTQFYPGSVLGIINDLVDAIEKNDVTEINTFLQQLGRTPFLKKQRPTPVDEAASLIWYLENVFYDSVGNILSELGGSFPSNDIKPSGLVQMGFWSGGDRDGNPFVTVETTLQVADALRRSILKCYYGDARKLKRRLTFTGVEDVLVELEKKLYHDAFQPGPPELTKQEILDHLTKIRETILSRHNGLFVHLVDNLIFKAEAFGLYFASLDVRQDSGVHKKVLDNIAQISDALPDNYASLTGKEKIEVLLNIKRAVDVDPSFDDLTKDTLETIAATKKVQTQNGKEGCERYVISHCETALNVVEVYGLFLLGGWRSDEMQIDIVPLFETIADLKNAADVMRELYEISAYREHLARRQNRQTVMLGFSDGTKDGGYLMANWSIYKAKDELTSLAREYGVEVIFFDGRGGPPARGGGKTHKFYSSMGENIAGNAIQLTVQGQTVSSNFGTVDSARYNIEQLLHAGIYNQLFAGKKATFSDEEECLMQKLADYSFSAYEELKNDPHFLDYLSEVSPLRFYAMANIGSRPSTRSGGKLTLNDLRAIPFVGAWSQIKQNVPGYYGLGSALKKMDADISQIAAMYRNNAFFKTLIDNCEMAMQKSFFALTSFLAGDPEYGAIWQKIYDEFELCRHFVTAISGKEDLMSDLPVEQQSVLTREHVVLPLVTIQQYALTKLREFEDGKTNDELRAVLEKLVVRCSFGIINAGRNSA